MGWQEYIPQDIATLYEIHDYRHAAAILKNEFPKEFVEICDALRTFRFSEQNVRDPGGSESAIPKRFSDILRPMGWCEKKLNAKVVVDDHEFAHDSHYVDYLNWTPGETAVVRCWFLA